MAPPKTTVLKPMRLPPLARVRVRRPNQMDANPCMTIMSSVLTCWASAGYNAAGCQALEVQLRQCMDAPKASNQKKNDINSHLSRFHPRMSETRKRR